MLKTIIKVENIYKEYQLGIINHGTLTHDLQSWWARIRGKEDPNSIISQDHNDSIEGEKFLALNDVSFDVNAGERIAIIGRNGAGKSTLLKILSRITLPTKGIIKIKGRIGSLLEVGTGFHSELTGRENIYLNGSILGMTKKEINKKFDEIVDFAGVEKYMDTPVKRYSSGMIVRLGFAVAAHLEPEILIVDEVLAVGDAEFQKKAIGKMEDVSKSDGRTIIFVSHNMSAVQLLCTRGLLLENGKLVMDSSVDKTVHEYIKRIGDTRNVHTSKLKGLKILSVKHHPDKRYGKYTSESKLVAEVEFFTEYHIDEAYLNLVIEDHESKYLIHSRTDLLDLYPSFEKGQYHVVAELSRLSIKAGIYSLWFRIYVKNKNKNKIEFVDSEKIPLLIEGSHIGGMVNVPVKWRWNKIEDYK